MLVLSNLLTGQLALASSAHSLNLAASIPGTFAVRTIFEEVMVPSSSDTVAVASSVSGVKPAAPSTKLNFMRKQPACAAAISSSGLVPTPCSNLDLNEY